MSCAFLLYIYYNTVSTNNNTLLNRIAFFWRIFFWIWFALQWAFLKHECEIKSLFSSIWFFFSKSTIEAQFSLFPLCGVCSFVITVLRIWAKPGNQMTTIDHSLHWKKLKRIKDKIWNMEWQHQTIFHAEKYSFTWIFAFALNVSLGMR